MTATSTNLLRHVRHLAAQHAFDQWTDLQLLERFAAGRDEALFGLLVRRHGPMVLGLCRRLLGHEQDAEDAFQAAFLLLARKAGSIQQADVGGWLYRVAYHVAVRARMQSAKRRQREQRGQAVSPADPMLEAAWKELRQVVDEELQRLPDDLRSALVLCYLEGKTQDEAARLLGWSKGTLRRRLDQGRERLRRRLLHRGLAPTVALSGSLLVESTAPAVPAALAAATVRTAVASAASPAIAALAEGGLGILSAGKMKTTSVLVLLVTVFTGAGLWALPAMPAPSAALPQEEAKKSTDKPDVRTPQADKKPSVEISGRVLDPEGKPVRGAKLVFIFGSGKEYLHKVWAVSKGDGHFAFAVSVKDVDNGYSEKPWEGTHVVAAAEGYGFAAARVGKPGAADLTLRLVKDDVPIRGRILDLQGKPVSGVRVRIADTLAQPKTGDLTAFLTALKANKDNPGTVEADHLMRLYSPALDLLFPSVTTGEDGRFRLHGIGGERIAQLRIEGPATATQEVKVMTRPSNVLRLPGEKKNPKGESITFYGDAFDLLALPSRAIVGVVRAKDSGKPLAGVTIESAIVLESTRGKVFRPGFLRTTTDNEGRYRLLGIAKGDGNVIVATIDDRPYLADVREVEDRPGLGPVTVDFALPRGVWVEGRVTEKGTGKPLRASVHYFCFNDNPRAEEIAFGSFVTPHYHRRLSREDGSFRIPVLPGHGLIAVRAFHDHYIKGIGAEQIGRAGFRISADYFRTTPSYCRARDFHSLIEIAPKPGGESIACDATLDPGRTLRGTVMGPEGKPLAGARVSGLKGVGEGWQHDPLPGADFTVEGLQPKKSRLLQFRHDDKKLAGSLLVRGDEKGPLRVCLQRWGVLTGRLLTPDGEPLARVRVLCLSEVKADGQILPVATVELYVTTDKDGRFQIEGLQAGLAYKLGVLRVNVVDRISSAPNDLTVKPGETKDLGDLRMKPIE